MKVSINGVAGLLIILALAFSSAGYAADDGHGEVGHGGHDEHGEEHDEHGAVRLSEKEMIEFGVETSVAGPGKVSFEVRLPGEVRLDGDRVAHVVPRVGGVVVRVAKSLGDGVKKGEAMAVLESRELAETKSAYLASLERVTLAEAVFERQKRLYEKKIAAEKDFLQARKELAEARISLRAAEQKLHALGFTDEFISTLPDRPEQTLTRFEIKAPFDGTVIEKHLTLGEAVGEDEVVFVVADLSTVWVDLSVYQKDLPLVREGSRAAVSVGYGTPDAEGKISYVGPVVGEETRAALARVVLPNRDGGWRPGLFVTARVYAGGVESPVVVPESALQEIEGKTSIFIRTDEGFVPEAVGTGRSGGGMVEITSGLEPGDEYVSKGAFTLKAQMSKGEFESGHSH